MPHAHDWAECATLSPPFSTSAGLSTSPAFSSSATHTLLHSLTHARPGIPMVLRFCYPDQTEASEQESSLQSLARTMPERPKSSPWHEREGPGMILSTWMAKPWRGVCGLPNGFRESQHISSGSRKRTAGMIVATCACAQPGANSLYVASHGGAMTDQPHT